MNYSGQVTVCLIDTSTNDIKYEYTNNNIITNLTHFTYYFVPHITLSSQVIDVNADNIVGVNSYFYRSPILTPVTYQRTTTTPPVLEFYSRVVPPSVGTTNTLNTVLLGGYRNGTYVMFPNAFFVLGTPIVQTENDYLDIRYRISLNNSSKNMDDSFLTNSYCGISSISVMPLNLDNQSIDTLSRFTSSISTLSTSSVISNPISYSRNITFANIISSSSVELGSIFGTVKTDGSKFTSIRTSLFPIVRATKVGNILKHSSTSTTPMFIIDYSASGSGKLYPEQTTDVQGSSLFVSVNITKSGQIGEAEYKFSVQRFMGFEGNTYTDKVHKLPQFGYSSYESAVNYSFPAIVDNHGTTISPSVGTTAKIQKFSNSQVLTYDLTGFTIVDVFSGKYFNFDSKNISGFNPTGINQITTVGNIVWVACKNSGLYKVDTTSKSSTLITPIVNGTISTHCYGIDTGYNDRLWAVFDGGLCFSDDVGVSWNELNETSTPSFSAVGISNDKWNNVSFIRVSPILNNEKMLIVRDYSQFSGNPSYWWVYSGTSSVGPSVTINAPNLTNVSSQGSWYAAPNGVAYSLTYGSSGTTYIGTIVYNTPIQFVTDSQGNEQFIRYSSATSSTLHPSNTTISATVNSTSEVLERVIRLDHGICFFDRRITGTNMWRYSYVGNLWGRTSYNVEQYGWNGTNWELNNSGSKIVHSTNDALFGDLTIRFSDGIAGTTSFINTDFYTFAVSDGIFKDNISSLQISGTSYTKQLQQNLTDFGTVPIVSSYSLPTGLISWLTRGYVSSDKPTLIRVGVESTSTEYTISNSTPLSSGGAIFSGLSAIAFSHEPVIGDFEIQFTELSSANTALMYGIGKYPNTVVERGFRVGSSSTNGFAIIENNSIVSYQTRSITSTDVVSIARSGTTITLKLNGSVIYTFTNSLNSNEVYRAIQYVNPLDTGTNIGASVPHTGGKCFIVLNGSCGSISLGNSETSTGVYSSDFLMCDPTVLANFQISVDSEVLNIANETSVLSDTNSIILPSGRILVSTIHTGKPVQGKYSYIKK